MRAAALAGPQTFDTFLQVVCLRRVHRLTGHNFFKESTLRLRGAAISPEDHDLWKTHELESLDPEQDMWPGAGDLVREALVLVTVNAQAGRINGKRLAESVPLLSEERPYGPQEAKEDGGRFGEDDNNDG